MSQVRIWTSNYLFIWPERTKAGKGGPEALGINDTFEQTEVNSNVWEGAVLSLAGPVLWG